MRALLLFCLIIIISPANSQNFAPLGATWTFTTDDIWVPGVYPTIWEVTADTVVLGKNARLIEITQGGEVWWDTTQIIVYDSSGYVSWFNVHENKFMTYIDFNANQLDSWYTSYPYDQFKKHCTIKVEVGTTDSIVFNGVKLKTMELYIYDSVLGLVDVRTAVEQIGFLDTTNNNGLHPGFFANLHCTQRHLIDAIEYSGMRCYMDNIIGLIDFIPNETCDFNSVGIDNYKSNSRFNLYPNPSKGVLNLSWDEGVSGRIEVLNSMGSSVFQQEIQPGENLVVNLEPSLSEGLYYVVLHSENYSTSKKFLFQKN